MGGLAEDRALWESYDWTEGGHEWSVAWGGTESLWWGTLFPRIRAFVPTRTILEIAPGYGRCTYYLKELCEHLILVDLAERCIEACQRRFATDAHISYHVNDGKSLEMIDNRSIDFILSYDSLVHAECDVIEAYVRSLGSKLKPNGVGFLHHSNLGAYVDSATGELTVENPHLRSKSMTAEKLIEYCEAAGLQVLSQEIINWGSSFLTDCFSTFTPRESKFSKPFERRENDGFMDEAARVAAVAQLYCLSFPQKGQQSAEEGGPGISVSGSKSILRNIRKLFPFLS